MELWKLWKHRVLETRPCLLPVNKRSSSFSPVRVKSHEKCWKRKTPWKQYFLKTQFWQTKKLGRAQNAVIPRLQNLVVESRYNGNSLNLRNTSTSLLVDSVFFGMCFSMHKHRDPSFSWLCFFSLCWELVTRGVPRRGAPRVACSQLIMMRFSWTVHQLAIIFA